MFLNSSKLDSGITLITYKMKEIKSVSINLIINIGSSFESESENGICHFLEHMAFKGTKLRSARDIAEEFDAIGGYFNAYTSKERTVYYAKVLSDNIDIALDIISDIIQNSEFKKEEIEKELRVISQEIAQTFDSTDDLAFDKLYEISFKDQAFGRSILGTTETISKFDTNSFNSYVKKNYTGANMFLSIAGDVDHDKAHILANKLFNNTDIGVSNNHQNITYSSGKSLIRKSSLEQTTLVVGYESVPYINKSDFYHAQILSLILGGGMSSRLFQKIREEQGLSYSVGAYNSSYYKTGIFSLYSSMSHDNLNKVIELFDIEVNKIISSVEESELNRAKAQIKASLIMSEEKPAYKSEEIGKAYAIFGKYDDPKHIIEYVNNTTITDIKSIAQRIFSSKQTTSIVTAK
jgi:predicted Zn-dependent peptidase